jgi:hypothetical protein
MYRRRRNTRKSKRGLPAGNALPGFSVARNAARRLKVQLKSAVDAVEKHRKKHTVEKLKKQLKKPVSFYTDGP